MLKRAARGFARRISSGRGGLKGYRPTGRLWLPFFRVALMSPCEWERTLEEPHSPGFVPWRCCRSSTANVGMGMRCLPQVFDRRSVT